MICKPVCLGRVGTNVTWAANNILLQTEDEGTRVRIVMTIEQTETLIEDLKHQIQKLKEKK